MTDDCRHQYEGDFENGWTCRLCDNHSMTVEYYETVDAQKKMAAFKKAKLDLKKHTSRLVTDGLKRGLALALEVIQKPGQTLDEANNEISYFLGEMAKEDWPNVKEARSEEEEGR